MARMISGQPLTDEELIAQTQAYLDQADPMATDSFAMGDTTGTDVTGMTPDPNYQSATPQGVVVPAQTTSQSGGNFGVLDVPFSPPAQDFSYLEDPYSNLSKTQRRMLAFSAIKDAGMALQGKEGNSYATMMADITARADMARKAKAAQQQQAMMATLLRGGLAGLSRDQIMSYALAGVIPPEMLANLLAEKERTQQVESDIVSKESTLYLIDSLLNHPDLHKVLGAEGMARGGFGEIGEAFQPVYADLKARVEQLQGGVFLEAFESLQGGGQITDKEGEKAAAARARLSMTQSEDAFRQALDEYRFYIEQGIARLKGENIPPDTFYEDQDQSDPLGIRG